MQEGNTYEGAFAVEGFGLVRVFTNGSRVHRVSIDPPSCQPCIPEPRDVLTRRCLADLKEYFSGHRTSFEWPLQLGYLSPFKRRVLEALMEVSYGSTISYGALAREVGCPRAARAVGQAVATNPFAIVVPCHRVIRSDGSLGGFSAGRAAKQYLLRLEREHGSGEDK